MLFILDVFGTCSCNLISFRKLKQKSIFGLKGNKSHYCYLFTGPTEQFLSLFSDILSNHRYTILDCCNGHRKKEIFQNMPTDLTVVGQTDARGCNHSENDEFITRRSVFIAVGIQLVYLPTLSVKLVSNMEGRYGLWGQCRNQPRR